MATLEQAAITVARDQEGYLKDVNDWNEELAQALAVEEGIAHLTDRHWLVVKFMRNEFLQKGDAPSIRRLTKESGVPMKELYELFPKGPAKKAAKVAGIPKPKGCI